MASVLKRLGRRNLTPKLNVHILLQQREVQVVAHFVGQIYTLRLVRS